MVGKFILLACCLLGTLRLTAGALVADYAPESPAAPDSGQPPPVTSPRLRALNHFVLFTQEKDPLKQRQLLIKVLVDDPGSTLALQQLAQTPPELAPELAPELCRVAREHPEELPLALLALNMSALLPEPETARQDLAERVLSRIPEPEKLSEPQIEPYRRLVRFRLGELLKAGEYDAGAELAERQLGSATPEPLPLQNAVSFYREAARRAPDQRRWLGLRPSRKTEFQRRYEELLGQLTATDSKLHQDQAILERLLLYASLREFGRLRSLLDRHHSRSAIQLAGADLLLAHGEAAAALDAARRAVAIDRDNPRAAARLIRSLLALNRFPEADRELRKLPNSELREELEVQKLWAERRYDEVAKELDRQEAAYQKITDPQQRLAQLVRLQMQRLSAAEKLRDPELLKRATGFFQQNGLLERSPEIANAVGYISAELNLELERAEQLIDRALAAEPENGAYLDSKGWVLHRRGDHQRAAEYLRRALEKPEIENNRGVTLDHLGDVLRALHDPEGARRCYEEALTREGEIDFDPAPVQKKLEELK